MLTLVVALATPGFVAAHGIGVEVKLQGNTVRVEAFFDDDTAASEAKVKVTALDGPFALQGVTDKEGHWSFPIPAPGKYRVAVDAGSGHLAQTTLTIPASSAPILEASKPSLEAPEVTISEGATREDRTGSKRWRMAGLGVGMILAVGIILRRILRGNTAV
jgi:nickel transport protein